jgi:hypothetical protein
MVYFAYLVAAIWVCVMLFLAARLMKNYRLILNNLAPGAHYWGPEYEAFRKGYRFSRIDPALFNEEGQKHLKELRYHGTLFGIWQIVGFVLVVSAGAYFVSR